MDERTLRKMKRKDLLQILVSQSREIDRLESELKKAWDKVADREIRISRSGSLAEAAMAVYSVLENAQKAADLYVENVRRIADDGRLARNIINQGGSESAGLNTGTEHNKGPGRNSQNKDNMSAPGMNKGGTGNIITQGREI